VRKSVREVDDRLIFRRVAEIVAGFRWRPEIEVDEIPAPGHIAPDSLAIGATVVDGLSEAANGRLVLLHDPQGNPSWDGDFRCVSFIEAEVDADMSGDPMLPEMGWAWLVEALDLRDAEYTAASGTVTEVNSRGFGEMAENPETFELQIRASWTPILGSPADITAHLGAWADMLCNTAGMPPLPDAVVPLRRMRSR
jgi:hypothetical protein